MNKFRISVGYLLAASIIGCLVGRLLGPGDATADHHESAAKVKRVGMVIGIKPDQIEAYKKLHADDYAGVRDLLSKAHMRNFSIFMRQLDDEKAYLFGYYEYVGDDFDTDMAWLAAQERNKQWLQVTGAMQIPLQGQQGWAQMEEVYHND